MRTMAKYRGPTDDMGVVIMTMFPMTTSSMHTTICTLRTFVLAACQVTNTLARNAANHGGAVNNSVCVLLYPNDPTIVGNYSTLLTCSYTEIIHTREKGNQK